MKALLLFLACIGTVFMGAQVRAADADVVNERVPVSGAELERHWQVDCGAFVDRFRVAFEQKFAGYNGATLEEMRHSATMCSFIYQVNRGDSPGAGCPHYQAMAQFLAVLVTGGFERAAPSLREEAIRCE